MMGPVDGEVHGATKVVAMTIATTGSNLRKGMYQELWSQTKVHVRYQLYRVTKQVAKERCPICNRIGSGTLGSVKEASGYE